MADLTHSPFLQALGYAIINSLWQFALLWLLYVSINTVFKLSSHHKYSAGLLLQFAGFTWFAVTFTFYFMQFSGLPYSYYSIDQQYYLRIAQVNAETLHEKFLIWIMQTEKLLPYLSISYLALLIFSCCKWIKAYNQTLAIRTKGLHKIEVTWRIFVKQLSIQLGINREVKIYLSEMVKTPLTIGFFKPLILLPVASINHLNPDQMEAVIMHELAHIKRFDYLFNLFLAFIEIALFFNPFMLLISRHIKRERENCCDDWVLQYEYNPTSYACALLQIATSQSSSPVLAMKAAEDKYVLLNRIKRMIEKKERTFFNYRHQLMAFFVMLTVLSSLALLSSSHKIDNAAVSSSSHELIAKQITARVDNSSSDPVFPLPSIQKKVVRNKKQKLDKNQQKNNLHANTFQAKIGFKNTSREISEQINQDIISSEVNPVLSSDDYDQFSEDLEKNLEVSNARLSEVTSNIDGLKEREVALAEENLKELAIHLFNKNKAVFNQKKIIWQMKAAFEQIKLVKIQLELAKQKIHVVEEKRANVKENQLRIIPRFAPCDIDKFKRTTKKLQAQIEQSKKRLARAYELNPEHVNSGFKVPDIIFHLPFREQPHSFSFEFSTEPKVKVVAPSSFYNSKREKKINKTSVKEDSKKFKTQNISPIILNKLIEKDNADDFIIIRI